MKLLKNIFVIMLALAITAPAFAQAVNTTNPEEAAEQEVKDEITKLKELTAEEKQQLADKVELILEKPILQEQDIHDLINDTFIQRENQIKKFEAFHASTKKQHSKKRYGSQFAARFCSLILVSPAIAIPVACTSNAYRIESIYEKRKANYENVKKLYDERKTTKNKTLHAQSRFVKAMTELFLDDPAALIDEVAQNKKYFLVMKENNKKVVEILKNYNRILRVDIDTYSENAIHKLARVDANKYFESLVKYAGIKTSHAEKRQEKNQKDAIQEIKNEEKRSKERGAVINDIRNEGKNQTKKQNKPAQTIELL